MTQAFSLTTANSEQTREFEFVRATENAALNCLQWLGRCEKELSDASDGVFDLVDMRVSLFLVNASMTNGVTMLDGSPKGRPNGRFSFSISLESHCHWGSSAFTLP